MHADGFGIAAARRRITVLAPHLRTPLRNGADVYIWNKWGAVSPLDWDLDMVASDGIHSLNADGTWQCRRSVPCTIRGRMATLAGLGLGSDYLSAKFNTPAYISLVEEASLAGSALVVCSFPSTWRVATALGVPGAKLLLESHNFDPKLYLDRANELGGVRGIAGAVSAARSLALLDAMPKAMPLVALGERDTLFYRALGFERVVEGRLGFPSPRPRTYWPQGDVPRLVFVGALSTLMNEQAIRTFVAKALPSLRKHLDGRIEVAVAGSGPSDDLARFLRGADVQLHADLDDDALSAVVETSHATMLPFTSSNGLKLKFGFSASHGVPMASYIPPPAGLPEGDAILVSNDMRRWAEWLGVLAASPERQRACSVALQGAASAQSWGAVVTEELRELAPFMEAAA